MMVKKKVLNKIISPADEKRLDQGHTLEKLCIKDQTTFKMLIII